MRQIAMSCTDEFLKKLSAIAAKADMTEEAVISSGVDLMQKLVDADSKGMCFEIVPNGIRVGQIKTETCLASSKPSSEINQILKPAISVDQDPYRWALFQARGHVVAARSEALRERADAAALVSDPHAARITPLIDRSGDVARCDALLSMMDHALGER